MVDGQEGCPLPPNVTFKFNVMIPMGSFFYQNFAEGGDE